MLNDDILKNLLTVDNKLLIISDNYNEYMIKKFFSKQQKLYSYKIINPKEFIELLLIHFDDTSLNVLLKKGYSLTFSKAILSALNIYVNAEGIIIDDFKKNLLSTALSLLEENKVSPADKKLDIYFNDLTIIDLVEIKNPLYEIAVKKLKTLTSNYINFPINKETINPLVIETNEINDEVNALFDQLSITIDKGVNPEEIVICCLDESYFPLLDMTFKLGGYSFYLDTKRKLYQYDYIKKLINKISDIFADYTSFNLLFTDIINEGICLDDSAKKALINVFSSYLSKDYDEFNKELLIDELKNKNFYPLKDKKGFRIIDNLERIKDEQYLFVLGCYSTTFPTLIKNQSFFTDEELSSITNVTTASQNEESELSTRRLINNMRTCILSYSIKKNGYTMIPSNLIATNQVTKYSPSLDVVYSKQLAYFSYAASLDDYYLYHAQNRVLTRFSKYFKGIDYRSYDNQFTKIDPLVLDKYNQKMLLSYTSLNTYYSCPFSYYIEKYWQVKSDYNFKLFIGDLFHFVLEKLTSKGDLTDDEVTQNIKKYTDEFVEKTKDKMTFGKKEYFYIGIYEEWIKHIYLFNKSFMEKSCFLVYSLEKKIEFKLHIGKYDIKVMGKLDKVLRYKNYLMVVDYKTGEIHLDFSKCEYGLNLQLPFYLYLLSKENPNYLFAGAFLEHLLPNKPYTYDGKSTLIEKINNEYVLNGLMTSDETLLSQMNASYASNKYIKAYSKSKLDQSKTLNEKDFKSLINFVSSLVNKALEEITSGAFYIRPLNFNKESCCAYCKNDGICYHKAKDEYRVFKKGNLKDILNGGNTNE